MRPRGSDALRTACVTVLGAGFLRPFPGTWGSLVALVCFALLWWGASALGAPTWLVDVVLGLVIVLLASWASVRFGAWALKRFDDDDPGEFVLDEFAGQWVALLWLPPAAGAGLAGFGWVVAGQFLLFRICDIVKPPPARRLEHLPAGWGVLCDDLASGLYAATIGQLVWRLSPLAAWLGLAAAQ